MILDCKTLAANMRQTLREEIARLTCNGRRAPCLAIITVGEDQASRVYVRNKVRACEKVGINVIHKTLSECTPFNDIIKTIDTYNANGAVDGVMVQLPLPKHLVERQVLDAIDPAKDVDGLTTVNVGRLRSGQECFNPCTAQGIIYLLDTYGVDIDGKNVTIIGRSNIVGKPLADLMMAKGATVTQCHSRTKDLKRCTVNADVVVSAVGRPKFLTADMFSQDSIIIDVGINRDENGKLCGDVDFDTVKDKVSLITPVPGGVGTLTVVELLRNTIDAYRQNNI